MSARDYVGPDGLPIDEATLAQIFRPMSPDLFDDPICGAALRRLAAEDPDVIAAVAEVDRTLFWSPDDRPPMERLCEAVDQIEWLLGLRRVP
jgi:hypothetical protein